MADHSVTTGKCNKGAPATDMTNGTCAQVVPSCLMELSTALEHRRSNALTPYNAEAWEAALREAGIFEKYKHVPKGIREGF